MRIGFALIPDQQFIEKIMEAVNGLARQGIFLNYLGYTGNIPNIILFQGNFNKKFQYTTVVETIINTISENKLTYTNVLYDGNGWYIAEFRRDEWIVNLHKTLLQLIKDYIVNDQKNNDQELKYMTLEEKKAYDKYNYKFAGNPYISYLILWRTDGKYNYRLMNFISNRMINVPKKIEICKIMAYEIGDNNTCKKILYELEL